MTKLNRWPGEHHRPPAANVELFPDFDTTITRQLDDTVRNLRVLRDHSHGGGEEEARWQLAAFEDMRRQIAEIQKAAVTMRDELAKRPTKAQMAAFEKALGEKMDKRADTLRNTTLSVIGVVVALVLGLLKFAR